MPDSIVFSRKPVLVLGATGFIGSHVVAALDAGQTYRPVAASRRGGLKIDATDPDCVRKALQDVDCVINCIAGNDRTMIGATRALCDTARDLPPRRIVHLSSMAVYGAAVGRVREDQGPVAPLSGYGQAKIECERILMNYINNGGDAVILRPTCVFGSGSPQWTTRFARLLRARRIGDLGDAGDGCCNLAFIDDVVAAIIASLDVPAISGKIFNISSSEKWTWNEFLIAFAKALGATPVRRIPPRTLRLETKLLAPIRRVAAMAIRSSATEAITASLAELWRQDIHIDCSEAEMTLGLRGTSPDRMIAATLLHEMKEPVLS